MECKHFNKIGPPSLFLLIIRPIFEYLYIILSHTCELDLENVNLLSSLWIIRRKTAWKSEIMEYSKKNAKFWRITEA